MTRLSSMTGGFSGFTKISGSFGTLPPPPIPNGQIQYTSPGSYSWIAPADVTFVSVVCVGGGGGGVYNANGAGGAGGGSLRYKNLIPVIPGQSYTVVVGAGGVRGSSRGFIGNPSYFIDSSICYAIGGQGAVARGTAPNTEPVGTNVGDGGGNGGPRIGSSGAQNAAGGSGAGGYSGNGGNGGTSGQPGGGGSGGGGGGGGSGSTGSANQKSGCGGGVGLLGEGGSGGGGPNGISGTSGSGGSGAPYQQVSGQTQPDATSYGAGAGSYDNNSAILMTGGGGAVRLIWGENRYFPSTNTGNL